MNIGIPKKRFYMMRHGETVANAEGYAAGAFDTPLTDNGRRQAIGAQPIVESLSPSPKLLVHSNLSRAKDTAIIVNANLCLPMLERTSMAEQSFGDWKGRSWDEIRGPIMAGKTPPKGESMDMLADRVISGLTEILSLSDEPVLIVSHGGIFDALLWHFGKKLDDVKNCHLYEFVPEKTKSAFPWEIWHCDLLENKNPVRSQISISDRCLK